MKDFILHIFFPNKCPGCNKIIEPKKVFCDKCKKTLYLKDGKRCETCFMKVEDCNCKKEPKFFKKCITLYSYENAAKGAVLKLKMYKKSQLINFLADKLVYKITENYKNVKFDMVIPVPMYKKSYKRRGFNQSELLANAVAQKLSLPINTKILTQNEKKKAQHTLAYKQRKQNVKNIYRCKGLPYECRNILLVDDIATTRFTLNECSKMLLLDGAKNVYCACVTTSE